MTAPPGVIGVLGAGTMGAGIAQLACQSGARTLLHDPVPEALERGLDRIARAARTRRRARAAEAAEADARPSGCSRSPSSPSSRDVRARDRGGARVARRSSASCSPSSPSRSSRGVRAGDQHLLAARDRGRGAAAAPRARRRDALLQPAAGDGAARGGGRRRVLDRGARAGARGRGGDGQARDRRRRRRRLPRQPLQPARSASRGCGCCRSGSRRSSEIDRICRLGGGFRMGPFELMDLVGVDVGLDISRSFYEQSFGEPRWRPSPITVKTVAAGRLGPQDRARLLRVPEGRRAYRARGPEPPAGRRRRRRWS